MAYFAPEHEELSLCVYRLVRRPLFWLSVKEYTQQNSEVRRPLGRTPESTGEAVVIPLIVYACKCMDPFTRSSLCDVLLSHLSLS